METLLSLGPQFALPVTSVHQAPIYHLLADVECILKTNSDTEIQDRTRCGIANLITNYIHHIKHGQTHADPLDKFLNHAERVTKNFVKANSDVLIVPSDKGNKTVLIQADEYRRQMQDMVGDQTTYRLVQRDPTSRNQTRNNNLVKRLLDLKLIDIRTARTLKTYKAVCPRIYGQPKAHKEGLPLRPVVPNMTAPSYNLSKYVGQIIQKSINSPYNIKDSFSFCHFINEVELPPDYVLISLDVKSLFTSIPIPLIQHDIIMRWNEIMPHTNINLDLFLELVNFCVGSSYFVYDGKYYEQVFGTAMGNPLSPIVADLIMESLLDTTMRKLDFKPPFIRKYVDDLITAIPLEKLQHILDVFNSYDVHIQFTHELEVNNKLPFLDMLLVRQDNQRIKTEWYMKPIASGRFLDFLSYHPMSMKLNVAKNFISRVYRLSTNQSDEEKANIIDNQLRLNHYPAHLRHRLINRMTEHRQSPSITSADEDQQQQTPPVRQDTAPSEQSTGSNQQHLEHTYRSMVHIPHLSSRIERQLKREYQNIRLANRNTHTVNNTFSKTKDPVPPGHQTNVIYQIPCKDCPACYIGMTKNKLDTRMYGHKSHYNTLDALQQTNTNLQDPSFTQLAEKTALLQHSIDNNHRFDLGKVKIIDRHEKEYALPLLEMCHIHNSQNSINKRTDTESLNVVYAGILHALKNNTNINTINSRQTTTQ